MNYVAVAQLVRLSPPVRVMKLKEMYTLGHGMMEVKVIVGVLGVVGRP